jgi:protein-disulfide isomerase
VLHKLSEKYPSDVRVIFHSYPLDNECNPSLQRQIHPASCLASYAAECASEQGKFWQYADRIFADQQREFSRPDLEAHATAVGLDVTSFNNCMNSGRTKGIVRKDIEEATRIGVTATPTLVINGRLLPGLPTPEQFDTIVAAEKRRASK